MNETILGKTTMLHRSYISGTGSYLPQNTLTNKDLEQLVDTSDEWIMERTGVRSRHIASDGEAVSDMAFEASVKALESAHVSAQEIDLILVATGSPDYVIPNTACLLQDRLKARHVMAFDLSAACSGFLYGLVVADQFIQTGCHKHILLVGGDLISRQINYKDKETAILFGDGAGAVVLSRSDSLDSQILNHVMKSNGELSHLLVLPAGGSRIPFSKETLKQGQHYIQMQGREIFKYAIRAMVEGCQDVLKEANLSIDAIDWMIPHQANIRILEAVAKQLDFPMERVIVNLEHTGNTSAGSIPIALDEAILKNQIQRGQTILMTAFGAGLTNGTLLMKF